MEFAPFPKIPRSPGGCIITEKLDGTNASVFIGEPDTESEFLVGSRNRWITPEKDNYGFARWAYQHSDQLRLLGPGHHFGEWWGTGIQRGYHLSEKRFWLFNTGRWSDPAVRPACCGCVPVLYAGKFSDEAVDETMAKLRETGSIAAPGFMDPEGVVVFLPGSRYMFKRTYDGDKGKWQGSATEAGA